VIGACGWIVSRSVELGDELLELCLVAAAQVEKLDAEGVVGVDAADDAFGAKSSAVDLEAEIEDVAGAVACRQARLDQTAVETEVEDAAAAEIPVVDAEIGGAVARVTWRASALVRWMRHCGDYRQRGRRVESSASDVIARLDWMKAPWSRKA
jgi:hypothetical protein